MGIGGSSSKPLAAIFGAEEEGKRGPTLGSVLQPGAEAGAWRLLLAAPLRLQVFDARTAKIVPLEDASASTAIQEHAPFTAFCASEDASPSGNGGEATANPLLVLGCQDGTILVFALSKGALSGPLYELRRPSGDQDGADSPRGLEDSITVMVLEGREQLYAGSCGRVVCWDVATGELRREFHLPGGAGHPATPSTLVAVRPERQADSEVAHLWVGLDNGHVAVFDMHSGILVRSVPVPETERGPEAVMALAFFRADSVVFALSAHRRVSVWDVSSYASLAKYPAELMTCGADLSAMVAVDYKAMDLSLLVLAGVDGSLCVRRVSRRADGKINCVLLYYMESVGGDVGCPITSISYHASTDSMVVGDAGCTVALVGRLKEQLGHAASLPGSGPAGAVAAASVASAPAVGGDSATVGVSSSGAALLPAAAPAAGSTASTPAPSVAASATAATEPQAQPAATSGDSPFPVFQGST